LTQRAAPVNAMLMAPNQEWALDFVSDGVASGRGIRILTIVDGFTRECPAMEAAGEPRQPESHASIGTRHRRTRDATEFALR